MIRPPSLRRIACVATASVVATLTAMPFAGAAPQSPIPACANAAAPAQAVLAEHNKHCVRQSPPPPSCSAVSSVNIYAGPTGGFVCGSMLDGQLSLVGDATLYPLYAVANVQLYLKLTYGAGYYPLQAVPFAVLGSTITLNMSSQLATVCSFPLASPVVVVDSVELLTSVGFGGWFVHVYTAPLSYQCP